MRNIALKLMYNGTAYHGCISVFKIDQWEADYAQYRPEVDG